MANLVETSRWEAGIYQFETSDPVMGGPNGIDNRPTRELANRTLWLKNELAEAVASIGANKTSADQALALKADKAVRMIAGAGLSGGGDLSADRTIALATPSTLNGSTTNWVGNGATGHTHELAKATPTLAGVAKLVNVLDSSATDAAVSAAMAKKLHDEKLPKTDLKFTRPQVLGGASDVNLDLSSRQSIIDNLGASYINNGFMQAVYHNTGVMHNIANLPLSVKSPIQLDFYLMGGYSFIDCHYVFLNRSFRSRINWNSDTFVLDWKENLNDQNGVMLSGNQTVGGLKTYSSHQSFADGLRVSVPTKETWAVLAVDNTGVYLSNPESNKHLKLNDNGDLQYGGGKVFTYLDRSDSYTLNDTTKLATSRALYLAYADARTPSGQVAFFAGQDAPAGWLKANGAAVSRTVYAALFAAIGTRYGAGDGSTTFNLPDLRGLFLRALDEGKGIDVGRVLGSHQTDAMQRWFAEFTYQRAQINGVETVNGGIQFVSTAYGTPQPASNGWAVSRAIIGPDVNDSARVAGETRPTNMALLACIKI